MFFLTLNKPLIFRLKSKIVFLKIRAGIEVNLRKTEEMNLTHLDQILPLLR